MSFAVAREAVVRAALTRLARAAIGSTVDHPFDPARRTVVLLPGGMGSELAATALPWDRADPDAPRPRTLWGDLGALCAGSVLELEMNDRQEDARGHVIFADQPFLMQPIVPYAGVRDYFLFRPNRPKYNFVAFPYDWRRPVNEAARWLAFFLLELRRLALAAGFPDPLDQITLLAHSQGGLVATMFLHLLESGEAAPLTAPEWTGRTITVGTPFYGTDLIIRHFFLPMSELAGLRPYQPASRLPRVVASFPGPYILFFADRQTLDPSTLAALGLDLLHYPMRDEHDAPIDPYDLAIRSHRFPAWVTAPQPGNSVSFDRSIDAAKAARAAIVAPLGTSLRSSLFHIRGVRNRRTGVGVRWLDPGPDGFIPELDAEPFERIPDLPRPPATRGLFGDGLVPFWSAILPWTDAARVHDLQHAADHMTLVGHRETLEVVGHVLDHGRMPGAPVAAEDAVAKPIGHRVRALPTAVEAAARRSMKSRGATGLTAADLARASPGLWRDILSRNALG